MIYAVGVKRQNQINIQFNRSHSGAIVSNRGVGSLHPARSMVCTDTDSQQGTGAELAHSFANSPSHQPTPHSSTRRGASRDRYPTPRRVRISRVQFQVVPANSAGPTGKHALRALNTPLGSRIQRRAHSAGERPLDHRAEMEGTQRIGEVSPSWERRRGGMSEQRTSVPETLQASVPVSNRTDHPFAFIPQSTRSLRLGVQ